MSNCGNTGHIRNLLMLRHLDEFTAFCESQGWEKMPTKDYYEVLRMRKDGKWLLAHSRLLTLSGNKPVHATVWGNSADMAKRFYRQRREQKTTEVAS